MPAGFVQLSVCVGGLGDPDGPGAAAGQLPPFAACLVIVPVLVCLPSKQDPHSPHDTSQFVGGGVVL